MYGLDCPAVTGSDGLALQAGNHGAATTNWRDLLFKSYERRVWQTLPLQIEHLQLAAALERLAEQLGSQYRARAMLRLGGGIDGVELGAVVEPHDSSSPLPRFVAFGSTARTALAGINRDIRASNAPKATMPTARRSGRLGLSKLQTQLDKAATA